MMTSATGVLHFGVIRHGDREPVTAWYGKPESTTRRWKHSPQAYEGQRPRGPWLLVHQQRTTHPAGRPTTHPAGRPTTGTGQESLRLRAPVGGYGEGTGTGESRAGPLISRAKPQLTRNCAKFTRPGNPILHRSELVGKTLAQSQKKEQNPC